MGKISAVINTRNEEKNLSNAIDSLGRIASEIIVVDMDSEDKTVEVARSLGAKVYKYKNVGYVEPARNFAINKATGEWILLIDADEELSDFLSHKIQKMSEQNIYSFYRFPRKNIIFGQWIRHSRWWPDYNIRFFKKGTVVWNEIIHSVPTTYGKGFDLPAREPYAIIHHHYDSVGQYLERMNRYTSIQAEQIKSSNYKFLWSDLLIKPTNEFLSRFFAGEGYKDGVHGLALAMLQAFSELILYLKIWELEKFKVSKLSSAEVENRFTDIESELDFWLIKARMRQPDYLKKLISKFKKW